MMNVKSLVYLFCSSYHHEREGGFLGLFRGFFCALGCFFTPQTKNIFVASSHSQRPSYFFFRRHQEDLGNVVVVSWGFFYFYNVL